MSRWLPLLLLVLTSTVGAQPVTLTPDTDDGALTRSGGGSVAAALVADRTPVGCVVNASVVHEVAISLQGLDVMALWIGPVQVIPDACAGRQSLAGIVYDDGAGDPCPDSVETAVALDGGLEGLLGKPAPTNVWLALGTNPASSYPPSAVWRGVVNLVMGPCDQRGPVILANDFEEAD